MLHTHLYGFHVLFPCTVVHEPPYQTYSSVWCAGFRRRFPRMNYRTDSTLVWGSLWLAPISYKLIAIQLHYSYKIPDMTVLYHKRNTVHPIFQISISWNTICAEMVDFHKPGHKWSKIARICNWFMLSGYKIIINFENCIHTVDPHLLDS